MNRNERIEAEGETIADILQNVTDEYTEIKKALFDENGELRAFVSVYLNDKNVTERAKWQIQPKEGELLLLLPVIAGGAPTEPVISDERRKQVALDDSEIERYNKHLMLREIGVKGQKRIKAAKVIVIGAGALGSPVIQSLAAAGVGTIGVVDFDEVTLGNLQSQVIHGKRDLHRPKAASARDTIKAINPGVQINAINVKAEAGDIAELIADYDVVVDCTDNYPAPPPVGLVPTCAEGGTISPLSGIIGSIQANEVLKLLIGGGETLTGKTLYIDTWNLHSRILQVPMREDCPICGSHPTITEIEDFDYKDFCGLKQKEEEVPVETISADELAARIEQGDRMTIVDVREPHERDIQRFPHAIVIPIGQLARRKKELDPDIDTIFVCREGKRSILAVNTLREAGYDGPMYSLKGGVEAAKNIIFSNEGAWL